MRRETSDVKASVDLVQLVASRVELRKSGSQFVGLCPFHGEKTPSFFVHPERGFFCHGCGAKGDAIEFLMRLDGFDFAQALEQLSGGDTASRPARRPPAPSARATRADAGALWSRLAEHDETGEAYLTGRGLLYRDPDVLRFNVGGSGDWWLDERSREGYRVAFAVRGPGGNVQTISLRYALPGDPPDGKKTLALFGCPTKGAAIVSTGIEQLAGGDPEFAPDEILLLEGGTSWLGASRYFAQAIADEEIAPLWILGVIGASNAGGVAEAFASVLRWRTVLLGFDADAAGDAACVAAADAARQVGARNVFRMRPADGKKDWADVERAEQGS